MSTSLLTNAEADRLRNAAYCIWDQIAVDMCGSVEEAESYETEEIIECAFDAGRLKEHDPELWDLFSTLMSLVGYAEARRMVADTGIGWR